MPQPGAAEVVKVLVCSPSLALLCCLFSRLSLILALCVLQQSFAGEENPCTSAYFC